MLLLSLTPILSVCACYVPNSCVALGLLASSSLPPSCASSIATKRVGVVHTSSACLSFCCVKELFSHGDERARTADPLLARQALSQLSYAPTPAFEMFDGQF